MGRDGDGGGGIVGGEQNDVGEGSGVKGASGEFEEGDLGLEVVDLALELLLGLVGLLVALLARAGVTCVVVLQAGYALHLPDRCCLSCRHRRLAGFALNSSPKRIYIMYD